MDADHESRTLPHHLEHHGHVKPSHLRLAQLAYHRVIALAQVVLLRLDEDFGYPTLRVEDLACNERDGESARAWWGVAGVLTIHEDRGQQMNGHEGNVQPIELTPVRAE